MILGIDTAAESLGVALVQDAQLVDERTRAEANQHDAMLAPLVEELLRSHGLAAAKLEGIAVSAGPGSFTGLRIGMALAKGLCFACDLPLAAVPTLDAIAFSAVRRYHVEDGSHLLVALNARRGNAYHASYRVSGSRCTPLTGAAMSPLAETAAMATADTRLAGDAAPLIAEALADRQIHVLDCPAATAADVALLGAAMLAEGRAADVASCEPMYLQEFVVKQAKRALFSSAD